MKNHELTVCLRLWQDRQSKNQHSFQFHHWWSDGQQQYFPACEQNPTESDGDDDHDPPPMPEEMRKGTQMGKTWTKERIPKGTSEGNKEEEKPKDSNKDRGKNSTTMQPCSKSKCTVKVAGFTDAPHMVDMQATCHVQRSQGTAMAPGLISSHISCNSSKQDTIQSDCHPVMVQKFLVLLT
jgi:hypothetical protein